MRFIPITLDNVKNAAMMFVGIANKEPWNGEWTYSSAYARLFAVAKSNGFTGFITMDNNGLPCGFLMGATKNRSDGKYDFIINEICYANNASGYMYAKKTLEYVEELLSRQHVVRICFVGDGGASLLKYFSELGFESSPTAVVVEKTL